MRITITVRASFRRVPIIWHYFDFLLQRPLTGVRDGPGALWYPHLPGVTGERQGRGAI